MVYLVYHYDERTEQIDLMGTLSRMPRGINRTYFLERIVAQFSDWLAKLPNAGTRGFKESDIKRVYGERYQKVMSEWIARGWIELRDKNRSDLWWVSDKAKTILKRGFE